MDTHAHAHEHTRTHTPHTHTRTHTAHTPHTHPVCTHTAAVARTYPWDPDAHSYTTTAWPSIGSYLRIIVIIIAEEAVEGSKKKPKQKYYIIMYPPLSPLSRPSSEIHAHADARTPRTARANALLSRRRRALTTRPGSLISSVCAVPPSLPGRYVRRQLTARR